MDKEFEIRILRAMYYTAKERNDTELKDLVHNALCSLYNDCGECGICDET